MRKLNINLTISLTILLIYVLGQVLIGTHHPVREEFSFDAPADVDFLYYGSIANSVMDDFPPQNPAYGGVRLTQPFLQYYPAGILAKIFNPYNSIRILNVLYLIIFALILRRLFPDRYGVALIVLFASSTMMADINALGVDFIARGFTHVPFFILLTIALFHRKPRNRFAAIFIAALLNGYLMFMVIPYLAIVLLLQRKREDLCLLLASVAGLLVAGLLVSSDIIEKPLYFVFTESFGFDPVEMIKHGAPFIILSFFCRQRSMTILLVVSMVFGSLIHYNPFFPVFMSYFAGSMMLATGEIKTARFNRLIYIGLAVLFVGWVGATYNKYDPKNGQYYPRYDDRLTASLEWIRDQTETDDLFVALTPDGNDLALLMQYRPVYLGYIGHVIHLGIDCRSRFDNMTDLFRKNIYPDEVDYVFYGPIERLYFPAFAPQLEAAYEDDHVTIYKAR